MRILAIADVHGSRPIYNWLLAAAREHRVEAMILAGDLLGCPEGFDTPEEAQRHDAEQLIGLLDAAGLPVLYIMGNDDLIELDSSSKRVQSIHGRRTQVGRFGFVGYQCSLPFMGGAFEKPEAGIEADLADLAALLDEDTVFVSHTPAFGILDPGFGEVRIGSTAVRELLDRNSFRAHIHGHSHAGFGWHGKHFNVASAGHGRAMILDLESMQHCALG